MGVKERREREKLETRDLILEAARELFASEGYEGLSMRKLAEKIEYSPTAIYVDFADQEELFRALCHHDFAHLAQSSQSVPLPGDRIGRLTAIGKRCRAFGRPCRTHYYVTFMT